MERIESTVSETLPFEEWEYRRLLELYEMLDHSLLLRLIARGLSSDDCDLRMAAEDFQQKVATDPS